MSPLTKNFVEQLVSASNQGMSIPLEPAEMKELAEVWLTFQGVMSAITKPQSMNKSVVELYTELANSMMSPTGASRPAPLKAIEG